MEERSTISVGKNQRLHVQSIEALGRGLRKVRAGKAQSGYAERYHRRVLRSAITY